jgi:hypothetical protein
VNAFEFVFSLFGLLLGFSLVEVLSGLVRSVKLRKRVRIGWLTPLLGLFVMVDLTSFWSIAWQSREQIPASFAMMLTGLAITGVYYFSPSMVFPEKPEEWPDFDAWAALHKRQVMGGILLCNLIATALVLAPRPDVWSWQLFLTNGVLLGLMAVAALARPRWMTGAALGGMLAFYLWFAWMAAGVG